MPLRQNLMPLSVVRAESPDPVEVMDDLTAADFARFLETRRDYYDLIWIARTHNLDQLHEALTGIGAIVSPMDRCAADASEQLIDVAALLSQGFAQSGIIDADAPGDAASQPAVPSDSPPAQTIPAALTVPAGSTVAPEIVVDTEAVTSLRLGRQAALLNQDFDVDAALSQEFRHLDPSMHVF